MPDFRAFAVSVAQRAGDLLLRRHGDTLALEYTLRTNFKTSVDDESDKLIRHAINEAFPTHNIHSEEGPNDLNGSEFSWVIDPLDGTLPYTYGISDHFGVCIALIRGRTPILGVVYAPQRNELYVAEEGKGSFCNDRMIKVATIEDINRSLIGLDYGKHNRSQILRYQAALLGEAGVTYTVSYACTSVSLALVASGKLHGYVAMELEPWDMAAGVVILREAGAVVTSAAGKDWGIEDVSIIAANHHIHKNLLRLLRC